MQRFKKSLYLMPKRYTYFHVLFFMLKGSNMLCCKTPTMKDLGKNTIKPRITNVILYINTHNNCEKKVFSSITVSSKLMIVAPQTVPLLMSCIHIFLSGDG